MNERECLMAVFRGDKPSRTPWFADLSYLYSSMILKNTLDRKYYGEKGYLEFYKDLGAGIYFYAPFLWKTHYSGDIKYQEKEKGGRKFSEYITPIGSIRSVQQYLPSTYTWAYTEYFIKTKEDMRTMIYIFENTKYTQDYQAFKSIDQLWGGSGVAIALAPVPVSPIQKLLTRWAGVETTIDMYLDDKSLFEETILRIQYAEDEVFKILESSPAQIIEFPENLSSEITGKNFYEKYNMPYYRKRTKQLQDSGKYTVIHIDGTLRSCLPLLASSGFDAAEAVTPYPVGDVTIQDLRKVAGEDIIIWGGIPGALFSPLYSEEVFENHLKELLSTFPVGTKFVLGVADQVPPDGLTSRIIKVRQMVEAQI